MELVQRHVACRGDAADPVREHPLDRRASCLLVTRERAEKFIGRDTVRAIWYAEPSEQRLLCREVAGRQRAALPSDEPCPSHADCNGLAVQQETVAGRRCEGVPDRVAVVEDDAQARLALVGADNLPLELDRAPDHVAE